MPPAGFVPGKGGDFAGVVEQRRPAQGQVSGHPCRHKGGVGEQIVGVVRAVLVKADHGLQLRNHRRQDGGKAAQGIGGHQRKQFT